jgi:hypothetical protein
MEKPGFARRHDAEKSRDSISTRLSSTVPVNGSSNNNDTENLFPEDGDPEKAMLIRDRKTELEIQDKQLDQLSNNLSKLITLSSTINSEIEDQTQIISEVETKVDEANANTLQITKKISSFMMQQSGGNRTYCIIISVLLSIVILLVWILLLG